MEITLYQVDAFANKAFEGNPAAICPLKKWLPDELMQKIAAENNLSETAYFVPAETGYEIRWFTPVHEVNLCGHATLAAAYILFNFLNYKENKILFLSKSGILTVERNDSWLEMNFPSQEPVICSVPEKILKAFEIAPVECLKSEDYIIVFKNEEEVLKAKPNLLMLSELDLRGVIITAEGSRYDFVTRFFAPKYGINEDPVTGSAFTQLIPYWSKKLGKKGMFAKQVSTRGGEVSCFDLNDRVCISGKAIMYMIGKIEISC